ncbi:MAG: nascent polypeptide-associated complex protein [Candidatus Diapherotrites archaeon]|nr:nascent polypeptide-associated complex protein [Candidatus Diapherotrites archaeon]
MFPGGINPKQMGKMMRQMGIKSEDLEAEEIVIKLKNGKKLIFKEPQVQSIEMQGTKTYTVIGNPSEESGVPEEDVKMVAEQTGASKEKAKKALEESNGNIAEAIMKLKEKE